MSREDAQRTILLLLLGSAAICVALLGQLRPNQVTSSSRDLSAAISSEPGPLDPNRFVSADHQMRDGQSAADYLSVLQAYRNLFESNPQDVQAAWRLSMASALYGKRYGGSSLEKEKIFSEGRAAGEHSLRNDPNCAPCVFWTSVNLVFYSETTGRINAIANFPKIQENLERVISLDSHYLNGAAYRLLASVLTSIPHWLGGGPEKAKSVLEQAIQAVPSEARNYWQLARLLTLNLSDPSAARKVASKALESLSAALRTPASQNLEQDPLHPEDPLPELRKFVEISQSSSR